jgi:cytoskeleton protein RodZ
MSDRQHSASESVTPGVAEGGVAPVRLREAREAAGLHIAALAAALKVPVKKLEALEAGRYAELPDMTFARALASSACRHLKVDPAAVLEQIPLARQPALGDSDQVINAPFKGADAPSLAPMGWLSRPAPVIVLVLLIAALALWFWPAPVPTEPLADGAPSSESSVVAPAPEEPLPAAPVEDAPGVSVEASAALPAVAAVVPVPASASTFTATVTAQAADTVTPTAPAVASPVAAADSLLNIAVSAESWVEVVNGKGGVVVQRMFKPGDAMDFSAAPPYSVIIGRADVARVTVRGQPFDIAPYARNSVARFEVK